MGWLYMTLSGMGGHHTAKGYLDGQFTYERTGEDGSSHGLKLIASSCLRNRTYYAAAVPITNGRDGNALAIVCQVR